MMPKRMRARAATRGLDFTIDSICRATERIRRLSGESVARARKQQGLSQDGIAPRLDKPQSFVSAFEDGQRRVDVQELMQIFEGIGLHPVDLFRRIASRRYRDLLSIWGVPLHAMNRAD